MSPEESDAFFASHCSPPVMAILRGHGTKNSIGLARAARDVGITLTEIPIQSPQAIAALTAIAEPSESIVAGAGTVTSIERVEIAAAAGAKFTVSPGFDSRIARRSLNLGMAHLPGVATPTEIHNAVASGFNWVKAFPASVLGPDWIAAVLAPFPHLKIVATGGITLANAEDFLAQGAAMVSFGSAISRPEELKWIERIGKS